MVSDDKGVEWKGKTLPKGTVLLSNDNDQITISVKPYTYELDQQDLRLVDTEGNYADADVVPTAKNVAEEGKPATRTVSVTGEWGLAVNLKDIKVSEDGNSITNYKYENKDILYALEVNGKIVSPYKFTIATGYKNVNQDVDNNLIFTTSDNSSVYELSFTEENKFTVKQSKGAYENIVADAYLTFEGAEADRAKALDVTADGLTIKGSEKAAGQYLRVTVHVLGVNGKTFETVKGIQFAGSVVETGEISVADHKVTFDQTKSMMINVDGVFSYEDVQKMRFVYDNNSGEFTNQIYGFDLSIAKDEIGLFSTRLISDYYNQYSNCTLKAYKDKDKEEEFKFGVDAASDLNYIEFTTDLGYNSEAETGAYTLTLTLKDGVNEIKKVAANFNVNVPSFEEMFIKRTNIWDGNVVAFRTIVSNNVVNITSSFGQLYSLTADYSTLNPSDAKFKLVNSSKTTATEGGIITVKDDVLKDGKVLKDITAKYEYPLGGKFTVVSPEFTIHPYSVVDGFSLNYYVNNTIKDAIEYSWADGEIGTAPVTVANALTGAGTATSKYNGLAAFLNKKPAVIGDNLGVEEAGITAKVITTGYADVEAQIVNGALQLKNKANATQILKAPEGAVTSYDITVRVTIMDGAIKNTADYTVRITK